MKGNAQIVGVLNQRLAEKLTTIRMYMVHAEMCANRGLEKLHQTFQTLAIDELEHAETLIEHILFLEGTPTVSTLNTMTIGANVADMVLADKDAEMGAINGYNDTIAAAVKADDNGTRERIAKILLDEERHVDWAEAQRELIAQMGLQHYLTNQASGTTTSWKRGTAFLPSRGLRLPRHRASRSPREVELI
jgi:bacterioferritin